ncbi:LemA family protein [Candidatus Falkowbacteria bacterium]|nr:LemA family protein [Candidatus Falkowbacteria bacterium]
MNIYLIILGIVALIALFVIGIYNKLVRLKNRVDSSWADIDVQLKRRYDLIPNLVETVKAYATHEEGTLTKVIEARNSAMKTHDGVSDVAAMSATENQLSATLKSIFALSENYPDLKANTNFLKLQDELSDTENKIFAARRFFNSVVEEFNTAIEVFPNTLFVGMLGYKKRDFFALDDEKARDVVKVSF